jgi:hypothetical protein
MAVFKNPFAGNFVANLAIGVGIAVLTPIVVPLLAKIVKPAAKSAVKGGILISEMVTRRRDTTGDDASPKAEETEGKRSEVEEKAPEAGNGIARPIAKRMMKSGIVAYEKGRQVLSVAEDSVRELMAEAKTEMAQAPESVNEGGSPAVSVEGLSVAESSGEPAVKKTARKTPGASPRKPATSGPRVAKKSPAKPKKES